MFAILLLFLLINIAGSETLAPKLVTFSTQDGGEIYADLYGQGNHAVVLAHGGRFNKESWKEQARQLAQSGFRVLAIDFRGYGKSSGPGSDDPMRAPLHLDVLAAVRYLHQTGSKIVSIVGASMGAGAAGDASTFSRTGEIDRVVFLAGIGSAPPEKVKGRKLFIVTREDTRGDGVVRLTKIREYYEKTTDPKKLIVLEGSAHAQAIFETDQAQKLMNEILQFLSDQ